MIGVSGEFGAFQQFGKSADIGSDSVRVNSDRSAPTILKRFRVGDLPPIFLSQLCHLILRNALEGCDDPYVLRAAEPFYRSQLAAVHDGTLLTKISRM